MSNSKKTVYVLGAGFSVNAGGPIQKDLLGNLLEITGGPEIDESKKLLDEYLTQALSIKREHLSKFTLEDVFTPMDRCLADGSSIKGIATARLNKIRDSLQHLIAVAIHNRMASKSSDDKQYVYKFAEHLTRLMAKRKRLAEGATSDQAVKEYDPVSVISLNWDTVLDVSLHKVLTIENSEIRNDYGALGVVDYCCYLSSMEKDDRSIRPGLWALGARGFNIKLLKPHGSMNWLQCTNCQRLYVSFGPSLIVPGHNGEYLCRHCERCGTKANLRLSLVMPTFLKDLNNFQLKLVWQNTCVELMEATEIVFIGYSLPPADFEFRQLLSRFVRRDAVITPVLFGKDKAAEDAQNNYRQFFQRYKLRDADMDGADKYVDKLIDGYPYE
jgi:hypothetical protein